ncbi:hypothetical protein KOW79_021396 [Hemibagrus wyckioides]|uniref:small monomeric GTPase n=1 Tax=Hemibagrus wyckioides TaxID=337641 RepID=A0A9D3N2T6_9TELE|nr:hypothetical protein KOW79_021396 [Hemibagrus wyckioides]
MAIPIAILDCDLLLHGRGHKTLDRFDIETVSDEFLLTTFGFPREFIYYLVELLKESLLRRTQRSRAISPDVQILAALGFYTSGSFQSKMGDAIGISQASMSRCVSNVTKALMEKAPEFIGFNRDEATKQQTKEEFYRVAGIPNVLGVVDCAHIAIKAPNAEDSSYVNKKGFHSINCQLVCDARGLLLSAETHWPGSLTDRAVFNQSSVCKLFEEQMNHEGWLLGDNRYPLRKWLMTPVSNPETPADYRYNLAHMTTHEIVDRTFRALQTQVTYRCRKIVDKEAIDLEILDTVNKECVGPGTTSLESSIKWGDGFLIVYSVTDRSSFEAVARLKRLIDHIRQSLGIPTVIVANKNDMENGRAVRTEEGQALARDLRCNFFELSVAECSSEVEAAFSQLIREVRVEFHRHLLAMDKRSRVLQMRHALKNKLTRSKTMQW